MIVVDTSVILAFMDSGDGDHTEVADWVEHEREDLVTTPLIVAEIDHLIGARGGPEAQRQLWADLAAGAYLVDWWPAAMRSSIRVAERYSDGGLGLADASLVALAERIETIRIATLDERHFRSVKPLGGGDAFQLLPRDRG